MDLSRLDAQVASALRGNRERQGLPLAQSLPTVLTGAHLLSTHWPLGPSASDTLFLVIL